MGQRPQDSQTLSKYVEGAELFHSSDQMPYVTVPVAAHHETLSLQSSGFRNWLSKQFWSEFHRTPVERDLDASIDYMTGIAMYDGPCYPINTRVAKGEGDSIWIDLADELWRGIHVTADGWTVEPLPPGVKFRRPRGMLRLPDPQAGGSLSQLRPLLNLESEDDFTLVMAWLLATFRPTGPYPLLLVHGEQGSAKSTMCRMLRGLIDPNAAPLRSAPRTGQELMIVAINSWVVGVDNLSYMTHIMSDDLCRLSTGGGFSSRELYSDADEYLMSASRPVILNGIEDFAVRADLLDRSVFVHCPPILDTARKQESDIMREYDAVRPVVVGAMLDAAVEALKNKDKRYEHLPRMADFAAWVLGAEAKMPWEPGTFTGVYDMNRQLAYEVSLLAVPIAEPLMRLAKSAIVWDGTAADLLARLSIMAPLGLRAHKDWPESAWALSNQLRRISAPLLAQGVLIQWRKMHGKRVVRLQWIKAASVTPAIRVPESLQVSLPTADQASRCHELDDDTVLDRLLEADDSSRRQ